MVTFLESPYYTVNSTVIASFEAVNKELGFRGRAKDSLVTISYNCVRNECILIRSSAQIYAEPVNFCLPFSIQDTRATSTFFFDYQNGSVSAIGSLAPVVINRYSWNEIPISLDRAKLIALNLINEQEIFHSSVFEFSLAHLVDRWDVTARQLDNKSKLFTININDADGSIIDEVDL